MADIITSEEAREWIRNHTKAEFDARLASDPLFHNRISWMNYNQEPWNETKPKDVA